MTSQPLYVWHHMHYIWHHIHSLTSHHFMYHIKSTISYLTSTVSVSSHPHYRWYHSHSMDDIPSSNHVTSYPLYLLYLTHSIWHQNRVCWWHHTWHMYDIICNTEDFTSTLSQKTTVFMMSHPLQAWHETHYIRHDTHCIFVITNFPLISHPLLCDIKPTMCATSYALYKTSHPLLMSSHYCTYDITTSIYETKSTM